MGWDLGLVFGVPAFGIWGLGCRIGILGLEMLSLRFFGSESLGCGGWDLGSEILGWICMWDLGFEVWGGGLGVNDFGGVIGIIWCAVSGYSGVC